MAASALIAASGLRARTGILCTSLKLRIYVGSELAEQKLTQDYATHIVQQVAALD